MKKLGALFILFVLLGPSMDGYAVSLWQAREASGRSSFFTDRRAHRVGDIITVKITEISTAETNADTNTKRESSIKDEVKSWIKLVLNGLGIIPDIKASKISHNLLPKIETTASHEYKSKGKTTRSQKLTASITAKIVAVLPNGDYVIEGQRSVLVNGERQEITLTGEVRPDDIDGDNTVLSSRIANAKIRYKGTGTVGDKQNKGIMEWIFDLAWLF